MRDLSFLSVKCVLLRTAAVAKRRARSGRLRIADATVALDVLR